VNVQPLLGCATADGHEGLVKLLLEREDVVSNRPDKYDQIPLRRAAFKGPEGVVKLLSERRDVDLNSPDADAITPFWWAAGKGYEGVTKLLLEREDVVSKLLGAFSLVEL